MSNYKFAVLKPSSVIYFPPSVNKCAQRTFVMMLLLLTIID